jgi:hypothetical protein
MSNRQSQQHRGKHLAIAERAVAATDNPPSAGQDRIEEMLKKVGGAAPRRLRSWRREYARRHGAPGEGN